MIDTKIFDEMARKFTDNLPPALKNMQSELEKNFRAAMQSGFQKMDLVTREEFDAQAKVLERTRKKVETLQKQVDALMANEQTDAGHADAAKESSAAGDAEADSDQASTPER